jgi:hypothetical protein
VTVAARITRSLVEAAARRRACSAADPGASRCSAPSERLATHAVGAREHRASGSRATRGLVETGACWRRGRARGHTSERGSSRPAALVHLPSAAVFRLAITARLARGLIETGAALPYAGMKGALGGRLVGAIARELRLPADRTIVRSTVRPCATGRLVEAHTRRIATASGTGLAGVPGAPALAALSGGTVDTKVERNSPAAGRRDQRHEEGKRRVGERLHDHDVEQCLYQGWFPQKPRPECAERTASEARVLRFLMQRQGYERRAGRDRLSQWGDRRFDRASSPCRYWWRMGGGS